MPKIRALLPIVALALLLAACGSDDESDPTVAPERPTQVAEQTATGPATLSATPELPAATPEASPATAATPLASPVGIGSPIAAASPVVGGTPGAGPSANAIALPVGAGTPASGRQVLSGTVSLPGTINEGFVIADDGCVGLGRYTGVEPGQQVIVRDGQGDIIGVTELAATDSAVVCRWTFAADVPASDYYAVSIPSVAEHVYTGDEVSASGGRIELELP